MAPDGPGVENVLMQEFAHKLDHVRIQARRLVLARAVGLVLSMVIPAVLLLITIDWYWRFTAGTRWLLLGVWLTLVYLLCRGLLFPAARFHPSRLSVAHRLERIHPSLRGRCVPVVELEDTNEMASRSTQEASRLVSGTHLRTSLKHRPAAAWFLFGLGWLASIIILSILLPPQALTGSTRTFLPWVDARWPARTAVESLMNTSPEAVHGRGIPLLLRAANRTAGDPSGNVWVTYQIQDADVGEWRTDLLTDQGEGIHERVVASSGNRIEFRFHTEDATTDIQSLTLLELPRILEASITTTPPEPVSSVLPTQTLHLGEGGSLIRHDGSSILRGSRVQLDIRTNRPIPAPDPGSSGIAAWATDVLGWSDGKPPDIAPPGEDPSSLTLEWTMEEPVRLVLQPHDSNGLHAGSPWVVSLDSHVDRPPTVALVTPPHDQSVLPTAILSLSLTASDDIGLSSVGYEIHPDTPALHPGSASSTWQYTTPVEGTAGTLEYDLDLDTLQPEVGTTLYLYATAMDLHPGEHGTGRVLHSAPRRIQVVDDTTFMSMLRQRLGILEQRARQIDERQAALQRLVQTGSWTSEDQREQAAISRLIRDQESILDGIRMELSTNRTTDERIESLVSFAAEALDRAETSSHSATVMMESINTRSAVLDEQESVRFELQELVAILGEDEESWVVMQRLQHFIEAQSNLKERTASTSAEILGLVRDDMSIEQVEAIDSLASEQLALTENAMSLVEAMQRQATSLRDVSDDHAESMEEALDIAEASRLVEQVQNASRQITDARIESAVQTQQQVVDALTAVRSAMESSPAGGVRELARKFEDLKVAVQRLVSFQRRELLSLDAALADTFSPGLDESMIRLRTNTLSVADDMRRTGERTRVVAHTLDLAAGAQGSAVTSLRSTPVDGEGARIQEEVSLEYLESVLSAMTSMADQARSQAAARDRDDLSSRYEALAEREANLYRSSIDLQGVDADRRVIFDLRRLSRVQEEIRIELADIIASVPELEEAGIFQHAHERLDELTTKVRDTLASGRVNTTTLFQEQSIIRHLHSLSDSLDQGQGEPGFSRSQPAGGGESSQGSGQQPLVPPVAEIKLLRSMQQEILETTELVNTGNGFTPTTQGDFLAQLAGQQDALAELGLEMIRKLRNGNQDTVVDVQPGEPPPPPPPGWFQADAPPPGELDETMEDDWPDLDELLDLEPESPGTTEFPDLPPLATGEEEETPLHSAVDGMRAAAQRLVAGEGGLETQRVQKEVVAHLDALLDMARRQPAATPGQGNSDPSQSSGSEPGNEQGASEGASTGTAETQGEVFPPSPEEATLGGVIEEPGSEWGTLPARVRDMLRQGRQGRYSVIYEHLTAEYYRKLAEEAGRE